MKKKLSIQDIANHLAQIDDVSKKDADAFVRAFFEVVEEGLHEDNYVKIKGFGTFKLVSVSERESVNVNTGERIHISGHTKVTFTPDTQLKELVNRPFAHFETVDLNDDTEVSEFEVIDEEMERQEDDDEALEETELTAEEETEEATEPQTTEAQPIVEQAPLTTPIELESEAEVTPHQTAALEQPTPRTQVEEEPEEEPTATPAPQASNYEAEEVAIEPQSAHEEAQTAADALLLEPQETAEDIVVTEPAPIVEQSAAATEPTAVSSEETALTEETSASEEKSSPLVEEPKEESAEPSSASMSDVPAPTPTNVTVGYTYGEVPMPKPRRNWWKVLALVLGVFILMVASYFVGYYRILCPTCYDMRWPFNLRGEQPAPPAPAPTPAPQATAPVAVPKPNPEPKDSAKAAVPTETPTAASASETPQNAAPKTPSAEAKPTTPSAPSRPKTHCVKVGDNLYRIARKYYGSDKYVQKIIEVNHLKDANNITVGKDIVLP